MLELSSVSSKRKRKKKIRRIIDDAELGEETRRKIAIEKVFSYHFIFSCFIYMYVDSNLDFHSITNAVFPLLQERQERLKSLQVQFSSKSKVMSSVGFNGNLSEDASTEVLGDVSKGYIVNVVRENGEEAVRIPPSISAKLKVHQVFFSALQFL